MHQTNHTSVTITASGRVFADQMRSRGTGWAMSMEKVPELNSRPNAPSVIIASITGQNKNGNMTRILIKKDFESKSCGTSQIVSAISKLARKLGSSRRISFLRSGFMDGWTKGWLR